MKKPRIPVTVVATIAGPQRIISVGGGLPWNHREERKHFHSLTAGQSVIMGRKSFETNVRDLSRSNVVVLTHDIHFSHLGAVVAYSTDDALQKAVEHSKNGRVVVAGGVETFTAFLPYASAIELTVIHNSAEGDASFPEVPEFRVASEEGVQFGRTHVSFVTLERQ